MLSIGFGFLLEGEREAIEGFAVQNEEEVNRELCELNELGFCCAKRWKKVSANYANYAD